ncbi:hypothetical protein PV04_10775 [Phialophora macrospora]|uniref:Roadblock/LAMTOR2 domain-containing protein n=1 Tax=Phialophora macrospora TaxID=1851006 RepID=A0A0D2DJS1_9EURO|nr:hypothetical protein PV04_10775 [Phialophora macrospora]
MNRVFMLDSDRLSSLLEDALSWSDHVSSLLVSAANGSILAYAYRHQAPKIKQIRTQSTTMATAYTIASEDMLVFEAQNNGAISVIAPVADRVLLSVTGPEPKKAAPLQNGHASDQEQSTTDGLAPDEEQGEENDGEENGDGDTESQQIREDLESVSQELVSALRAELSALRWPDDI